MIRAFAIEQVRAAEARVMADLPEDALMHRAADGLVAVAAARAADLDATRVVVLAGPGYNGGDALFAAAGLARRADLPVAVLMLTPRPHAAAAQAVESAGLPVVAVDPDSPDLPPEAATLLAEADLVLDGLLGIGGRPGLPAGMAAVVDAIPEQAYVIAVDLPSGVDPHGVAPVDDAVFADETVTFAMVKPAHLLPSTEPSVGRLSVIDIGVPEPDLAAVARLGHDDVPELWPVPGPGDDKYSRGVLGVVAGTDRYPGAAVLTCTAALEAGVGMVRYVGPERVTDLVLASCPEVVPGAGRVQAWVLGPGLAEDDQEQQQACDEALSSDLPCLLDAGALEYWQGPRQAPTVLTPHAGEAARLLSRLTGTEVHRDEVRAAPVEHLRRLVEVTEATVLLKGDTTLVCGPQGLIFSQTDGPSWLATAGAGDVLSGVIGVLLASGLETDRAAALGALVHGVAADRANPGGPVRAAALASALPGTVASLLRH